MSWNIDLFGKDRTKLKEKVRKKLTEGASEQHKKIPTAVADSVDILIDQFAACPEHTLHVVSNGHIESYGGSAEIKIRAIHDDNVCD